MGSCRICGRPTSGQRKTCSDTCKRAVSSLTMSNTNREYCSERQKKNNTIWRDGAREKLSNTLKEMCWKPKVRGGNGKDTPIPAQNLFDALTEQVELACALELAVPTRQKRHSGYPTCYKLDMAIPAVKLGIEVDGYSHSAIARKEQDKKKDLFLSTLGWKVLRFSNKEVLNGLPQCVETITSTILRLREPTPM